MLTGVPAGALLQLFATILAIYLGYRLWCLAAGQHEQAAKHEEWPPRFWPLPLRGRWLRYLFTTTLGLAAIACWAGAAWFFH